MTIATNTYSVQFTCRDPETRLPVLFTLSVKTKPHTVVRAPDLLIAAERFTTKPAYLEDLADRFKTQFPGEHVLKAKVHGVDVVATRQGTGT